MDVRYYWAIFVKCLVTNVFADASTPQDAISDEMEIEGTRLGIIISNAELGRYEDAGEVMKDVQAAAEKMEIKIVGDDEVDIGGEWDDVFEVCGRQLCFCEE